MDRYTRVDSSRDAGNKKRALRLFFGRAALYFDARELSSQESSNNYNNRTYRPFPQMRPRAAASIEVFAMKTAWEKFQSATVCLARSGGIKEPIDRRVPQLSCARAEEDLPKELRDDFRAFGRALTREAPAAAREDAFRATIRKMSNDEADQIATTVVLMFAQSRAATPPSSDH